MDKMGRMGRVDSWYVWYGWYGFWVVMMMKVTMSGFLVATMMGFFLELDVPPKKQFEPSVFGLWAKWIWTKKNEPNEVGPKEFGTKELELNEVGPKWSKWIWTIWATDMTRLSIVTEREAFRKFFTTNNSYFGAAVRFSAWAYTWWSISTCDLTLEFLDFQV